MRGGWWTVTAAALLASGCAQGNADRPAPAAPATPNWRTMATSADRERLRNWRTAWMAALAAARVTDRKAVAAEGALFDPDRALLDPLPPPGAYRCRVFKLGTGRAATPGFIAYPFFDCRIDREGDVLSFYKHSGSQRPVGLILPDTEARGVFLGTLMLGDETAPLDYGRDAARDMAGRVERVAERRWRVVLPYPRFESTLDVIELTPAG
ncbi:DUF4893 domain-containing protein [Sphingomonas sp. PL-96]|uniref:DUF4893 domain-containing protein n=1 Tax=Sphingomonas sp. PL-96 TaxID=2887201 RepID=UPI001E33AC92|nr:DUF4893 domain-containing protein [Sphingomonas sp. PL-96]MCC2976865.1 DUF4893 domain-containing protein [Sphingomonas sp. PL-96]